MANFTEDQQAALGEILDTLINIPYVDPVPTQQMIGFYVRGYIDARSGEVSDTRFDEESNNCACFCACYCLGFIAGTT